LANIPGTFWDEERGLNEKQYIVPGGGGFGEIMNNSFV
jgi:uracil phosphoribosyltransferase